MQTMSNIARIVTSLLAGCALIVVSYLLLASAGAEGGWYYAVGICITGFMTYRILVPALGVPVRPRWLANRRRRGRDKRLPGPIH